MRKVLVLSTLGIVLAVFLISSLGISLSSINGNAGKTETDISKPKIALAKDLVFPEVPDRLTVYRIARPTIDASGVVELSRTLGLNASVEDRGDRFYVQDGSFVLEVRKDTGYTFYANMDKIYIGSPFLLSDEEAITLAKEFLIGKGLMPLEAEFKKIVKDEAQMVKIDENGKGEVVNTGSGVIQVWFGRKVEGMQVLGSGCVLSVCIAGKDVVGLYKCWKDYLLHKTLPTITPSEAFMRVKEEGLDHLLEGWKVTVRGDEVVVRGMSLAYLDNSRVQFHEDLLLVYVFEVDVGGGNLIEKYVPAVFF